MLYDYVLVYQFIVSKAVFKKNIKPSLSYDILYLKVNNLALIL